MDLSDEDRKQLDRLMEQHLNGELSDEEYQRRSWEILKEKQSPPASRVSVDSKGFVSETPSSPSGISQSVSRVDLERLDKRQARGKKRLLETVVPLAFIFIFGIGFALVFGMVKSGPKGNNPPIPSDSPVPSSTPKVITGILPRIVPDTPAPPAASVRGALYFTPTFGPLAVNACKKQCTETREGTARQACIRDCPSLSLGSYGRRITLDKLDPAYDAGVLYRRCTGSPLRLDSHSSGIKWEEDLESAAELLNKSHLLIRRASLGSMNGIYERLLVNIRSLKAPPGLAEAETRASEQVVRASCLRAGVLLAEIAAKQSRGRSDEFSTQYYSKYRRSLDEKAAPYQHAALTAVGSLGLFSYE